MNTILIHNDNLSFELIDGFVGLSEKYDYLQEIPNPNFNLDRSMSLFIKNYLTKEKFDVIFLPYSFSNTNYFELTGLRLAAHIRFTEAQPNSNTPIVFIGNETPEQINKISSDLGNILFTPGIFHTSKQSLEDINAICQWISDTWYFRFDDSSSVKQKEITEQERNNTIKKIVIQPPANYKSHHSIDNEFTLLKWSRYLGCAGEISEVKENISTGLYFKYLYSDYLKKIDIDQHDLTNHNGIINFKLNDVVVKNFKAAKKIPKVILIDDQYRAGWKDLFEYYFNVKSNKDISNKGISVDFECFEHDFRNNVNKDEVISNANSFIRKVNPDLVLLDLRLCDEDFEDNSKPEILTGFKILKNIKIFNKGIQVIIFTASNKAWNFEYSKSQGLQALSFIVKSRDANPVDDLIKLKNDINSGLETALFLKDFFEYENKILEIIKSNNTNLNFIERVTNNLEISFELLKNVKSSSKFYNHAYLQLFLIIEDFISLDTVFIDGEDAYVVYDKEQQVCVKRIGQDEIILALKFMEKKGYEIGLTRLALTKRNNRLETYFKVAAVLIFKYGNSIANCYNWNDINQIRNSKAGHFDIKKPNPVNPKEIKNLLNFLVYFLDVKNNNPANIELGIELKNWSDTLLNMNTSIVPKNKK